MSTRGAAGYVDNCDIFAYYNQWDSYPEGLGNTFLKFIKQVIMDVADIHNIGSICNGGKLHDLIDIYDHRYYPMLEYIYLYDIQKKVVKLLTLKYGNLSAYNDNFNNYYNVKTFDITQIIKNNYCWEWILKNES